MVDEEELIEHFRRLAIESKKAAASVLAQEVVEIQDSKEPYVKKTIIASRPLEKA